MRFCSLICLFFICSCAGYRFQERSNPFSQYGISSLSIPMFYNQSALSNVTPYFTKEIYKMLSNFEGLKVQSGKWKSDATLIGIIESQERVIESIVPGAPRSVENITTSDVTEQRGDFYVPSASTVGLTLKVIVIKDPTKEEIAFLRSNKSKQEFVSSKIIFRESIPLQQNFTREVYEGEGSSVIHTQNRGALKKTVIAMSRTAAQTFREMILYAF